MRVAVFSTPRSCSSYVIHITSKALKIQNYQELYTGSMDVNDLPKIIEEKLYNTDDYAIKFMSTYFSFKWFNIEDIHWDLFDKIIFTERDNITDHICSWYAILSYNQELHDKLISENYDNVVDIIQDRFFDDELITYKSVFEKFIEYKKYLKKLYPEKCITLKYEMFQKNPSEYIDELNKITGFGFTETDVWKKEKKIDYKKVFPNYNKLEEIVNSWDISYDD